MARGPAEQDVLGPEVVNRELAGAVAEGRALVADEGRFGRRQEVAEAEALVGRRRGEQGRVVRGRSQEAATAAGVVRLRVMLVVVVLVRSARKG